MRNAPFRTGRGRRGQRGFSLVTSLLFMVAALVLGISVLGVAAMQERIIGNTKDADTALQAAEATLRDAEADIRANITPASAFTDACNLGLCTIPSARTPANPLPVDKVAGFDWTVAANVRAYGSQTGAPALSGVAAVPVYVIEKLGPMGAAGGSEIIGATPASNGYAYRITARSVGARAETVVVLQSIYAKQ